MEKNINKSLKYYFTTLFLFAVFFLNEKSGVGNDSTISEWIINYSGGFTKRGIIGQICVNFSNFFGLTLRDSILIFQIFIIAIYFLSLYFFFKDLKMNKIMILAIFTPIFILYPVAEIEVLGRKEVFIFCFYLAYLNIKNYKTKIIYKIILLPLTVLIWEPVIFFFHFWLVIDIFDNKLKKLNPNFFSIISTFIPAILVAIFIILNPISADGHSLMVDYLKINFNETCFMSCALLRDKASVYEQFTANFSSYSFVVFFRYFLIILIGFGPLIILSKYSKVVENKIIFFKNFNNFLVPLIIMFVPILLLFAMGYDWGRWVNISYVFFSLLYFSLLKKNLIELDKNVIKNKLSFLLNKKIFTIFFIIFCFGWNPKTVITGDVASKPGYQIPRKTLKIIYYKYIKD